ncbi:hypothetical protein LZ32DRAFT_117997 [Colletotrichum eremochloae]|nr:hypothetical protein LZ32DRAFT_117997 [Colletotrichum eremochloae]
MVEQTAATTPIGHQSPEETDTDVIYLGTFKVKDPYRTTGTSRKRTERNGQVCLNNILLNNLGPQKRRHRRTDAASTRRIPADMTYKPIRLGRLKGPGGLCQAVYGFFDCGGRLRRRVEIRQRTSTADPGPCLSAALVTHGQVEYRSCFRGLTHQQVRKELRCQIAHAADGEI